MHDSPDKDLARILFDRHQVAARVRELGRRIAGDLRSEGLTVVPIMSGAMIFAADLIRELPLRMTIDLLSVGSYSGASTVGGDLRLRAPLSASIEGRHVLVVDDIFDTGRTLKWVCDHLAGRGPAGLKTCVLLRKPARREVDLEPDYVGFDVPDEFVVGYGLDFDGHYRNLADIGVLRPELYRKGN
jgi:hypoxanthine phosphoribosyltransferase